MSDIHKRKPETRLRVREDTMLMTHEDWLSVLTSEDGSATVKAIASNGEATIIHFDEEGRLESLSVEQEIPQE